MFSTLEIIAPQSTELWYNARHGKEHGKTCVDGCHPHRRRFARFSFRLRGFWWRTGSIGLTFRPPDPLRKGVSRARKKVEKSSPRPLAPPRPFWYITHPLRPKGARSILENRTVLKERDPAAPRNEGEPPEGTRNTMNEKLVVRCPEPARAPITVIQQH